MKHFVKLILLSTYFTFLFTYGAAAAPIGALIAKIAIGITWKAVGSFLLQTALSIGLSLLTQTKVKKDNGGIQTDQTTSGGITPQKVMLGYYATGGGAIAPAYSHSDSTKGENDYLTYILAVSDFPTTALLGLIIDGKEYNITTTNHATYGFQLDGTLAGNAWVKFYNGSQTTADADLVSKYGSYPDRPWTSDFKLKGVSYAVLTFKHNQKKFSGFPEVRFIVQGAKLYDPRKDTTAGGSGTQRFATQSTWAFTDNPAVMAYNLIRGITLADGSVYGIGANAAALPTSRWFAAMNDCDAAGTATGTNWKDDIKTYRAGYEFSVSDEPLSVIEILLKACSGQVVEYGGFYNISVGAPNTSVKAITDADVIISKSRDQSQFGGLATTFNGVHATYPEPKSLWTSKDAVPLYNTTWETEDDGRRLVADLSLGAVPYPEQVRRIMRTLAADNRRQSQHTITLGPWALGLVPLDNITWTSANNGYVNKVFEITAKRINPVTLECEFNIRERDPADYSANFSFDNILPTLVSTDSTIPVIDGVAAYTVSAVTVDNAAGDAKQLGIKISWTGTAIYDSISYEVRNTGTGKQVAAGSTSDIELGYVIITGGLLPTTSYQVRARAVKFRRDTNWTDWVSVTTAVAYVDNADFAGGIRGLIESNSLYAPDSGYTLPATGSADRLFMNRADGKLYSWNGTAWVLYVQTALAGVLDQTYFAAGIRIPRLVTSLPATGSAGDLVTLSTDGKLYRYNGSAWTAAISATDVSGQLVSTQIADNAITNVKIANSAITDAKLANATISAAKFATGLEPITTVATLPTVKSTNTIYYNSELYRWDTTASAYVKTVNTTDLSGTITNAQITSIATTKLTGTITDAQIAAIAASKVTGTLTNSQIADLAAAKLTGAITETQISNNSISTVKLQAGSVVGGTIAGNTILASHMTAGSVVANTIAANSILASKFVLSDTTNLFPDFDMLDLDFYSSTQAITSYTSTYSQAGRKALGVNAPASGEFSIVTNWIPVSNFVGELLIRASVYPSTAGATATLRAEFGLMASGGTITSTRVVDIGSRTTVTAAFHSASVAITTSENVVRLIAVHDNSNGSGLRFGGPQIFRKAAAELIVDGAIKAYHITANTIGTSHLVAGAVVANTIAANSITTSHLVANSVTTNALAAGSVTTAIIAAGAVVANSIAAGAIVASKITVSDPVNAYPDFDMVDPDFYTGTNAITFVNTGSTILGRKYAQTVTNSAYAEIASNWFGLNYGGDILVKGTAWQSATGAGTSTLAVELGTYASGGSVVSTRTVVLGSRTTTTTSLFVQTITLASNENAIRFVASNDGLSNATLRTGGFGIFRKNGGELIVDGAITGSHIQANTITGNLIQANTINGNRLTSNTITGNLIQSNTITGNLIVANTINGNRLIANTITGNLIVANSINAGHLMVDSVTAGVIAAGAIGATQIAADAILTRHLAISDTSNIFPDPDFTDATQYSATTGLSILANTFGGSSRNYLNINSTGGTVLKRTLGPMFSVNEYLDYSIACKVGTAGTAPQPTALMGIRWYSDLAGTVQISDVIVRDDATVAGRSTRTVDTFTAPAGAVRARLYFQRNAHATSTGSAVFHEIVIRRMANAELIVDGTITANKLIAASITSEYLSAPWINGERLSATYLDVDGLLTIGPGAGLRYGKSSVTNDSVDGIYFGVDSANNFGFAASRTANSKIQSIKISQATGLQMLNAKHYVSGNSLPVSVTRTASTANTALPAGVTTLSIELVGGGAAGWNARASQSGSPSAGAGGSSTVVRVYDGTTLKATYTAAGGGTAGLGRGTAAESTSSTTAYSIGQGNPWAGGTLLAGTKGAGGGGGLYSYTYTSGEHSGGNSRTDYYNTRGGLSGQYIAIDAIDLSGYAAPKIEVVIGAGGAAGASGKAGGAGQVIYRYQTAVDIKADVVPLTPTATGSFSKAANVAGSFPDLGAGLWVLTTNSDTNLNIGSVFVSAGVSTYVWSTTHATIISDVTPTYPSSANARTIYYTFYSMGNWG